jgi:hypothetical protein
LAPTYTLKLGDTTQELTSPVVLEWAKQQLDKIPDTAIKRLSEAGRPLSSDELVQPLFDYGLDTGSVKRRRTR